MKTMSEGTAGVCVLDCDSLATRAQKAGWRLDKLRHNDFHQYIWLTRGNGRVKIEGSVQGFTPNTAIFIPAMTVHALEFTPGSIGWTASVRPEPTIHVADHPIVSPVPRPTEQAHLTAAFSAINAEFTRPSPERAESLVYLSGLLAIRYRRLATNALRSDQNRNKARRKLMQSFIERLEQRYTTGESVRDYAKALGVTTTHLTRICRETTGKPATRLIRDRTILEAKRKLSHPQARINQISEELGFRAPSYFSRVFSDETGKSPKAFWQANRLTSVDR